LTRFPTLEEIQSLEEALHRPEIRRCRKALETLLSDEFVEFGASGSVYDRTSIINLLLQERPGDACCLRAANYVLKPITDDAVLLTYEAERSHANGSRRNVLRSSIWKYDGLKWQMFFHQGTIRD
jgi:Uncharacterized protein conserved in bacteria